MSIQKNNQLALFIALILVIIVGYLGFASQNPQIHFGDVGTRDGIQYWSACHQIRNAGNPYDPVSTLALQKSVGLEWYQPVMMWNPPVILPIICQFFSNDFTKATHSWNLSNIAFWFGAVGVLWFVYRSSIKSAPRLIILSAIFIPLLDNFNSGQLGAFLLFVCAIGLLCVKRNYLIFAGAFFSLLFVKFNLFIILWAALLFWSISKREWRLLAGVGLGAIVLILLTLNINPNLFTLWIEAINKKEFSIPLVTVWNWKPDVLVGDLRAIWMHFGFGSEWLLWATPLAGLAAYLLGIKTRYLKNDLVQDMGIILALTITIAPYGWFSDYSLLLIPTLLIFSRFENWIRMMSLAIALQIVLLLSQSVGVSSWYPLFLAIVALKNFRPPYSHLSRSQT